MVAPTVHRGARRRGPRCRGTEARVTSRSGRGEEDAGRGTYYLMNFKTKRTSTAMDFSAERKCERFRFIRLLRPFLRPPEHFNEFIHKFPSSEKREGKKWNNLWRSRTRESVLIGFRSNGGKNRFSLKLLMFLLTVASAAAASALRARKS